MLIFEYQFDETHPRVRVEMSPQSDLSEVLEQFQGFLMAAGYSFDGNLTIEEEYKNEEC